MKPFSNYVRHDCGVKMLNFFKLFFFQRKVSEQNLSDIGFMSLLLSCQTDMAFWQNLLPQVLHSLRTSREHGISLFPIFWATNRNTTKKSCEERPKSPSLTLHYCNNCRYYSCVSIRRAQNLGGLSPRSGQLFSLQCSPPPHYQPMGAPYFGTGPRLLCLAVVVLFFLNHYRTWTNLKREAFTESQDGVKVHMEPLDSVLDFGGLILTEVICESPVSWPSDTLAVCWDRKHGISHTFIPWH